MLYKQIVLEWGRDTETGVWGKGYSPDNGEHFYVTDTTFGRKYRQNDADGLWNNGLHEKVKEKVNQEITNTVEPAIKQADSAVAYANDAIEKSRVNSQAIVDINSAVSDAVSDAAVARSDGLRAWDAAQSNVNLIDQNYASASAAISSARTEAIAAANEAKASASAAQADIVAVRSDVAAVQADVTANKSDVAVAKSDIAVAKTNLASQATSLSSYASQASAVGQDITVLKSQAGQLEQDMADTKGDVSQLKVSASSASAALSDAAGNISSLQATAKSYSAALSDAKGDIATVKATASKLETKYADAAGDISQLQADAKGTAQTLADAQGDIAKLKTRADGFDTEFANTKGDINKIQTDATGTKQTLTNAKSDIAVLQSRADGFDTKFADTAGNINALQVDASSMQQTLTDAQGNISTLQATATGFKNTLTDAQGNISTLQSDVAGLKKTTSDHAGNIATLQSDAKTLTSQMSSAQGDISTLKQTASGFSSKVSGMETSLANANSKLDGITSNGGGRNLWVGSKSFANAAVNVPKVDWNTDSDGIATAHITGTGGFYGKWQNIYANGTEPFAIGDSETFSVEMKGTGVITIGRENDFEKAITLTDTWTRYSVSGVVKNANRAHIIYNISGKDCDAYVRLPMVEKGTIAHDWTPAPEDTDAKITTNSAAIDQNKKAIALKADQTTVDKTNETVQQLQAQLNVQADQISAKVSSSDLDAKGYATQTYTQTQIKQASDSWNANLTSAKNGLTDKYTNLHATVDGIKSTVATKADQSEVTQLSNLVQTKVSSGDFTSTTTQLKNLINQRVQVGDVISQINQEAGGNTLIQVSNGKGSLILDAGNTIITGKAWIPSAAIANLTADDIKTGTLTGSTVHLDDSNGNTIDLGALSTDYVGFHSKATNGDQTYIDLNGIRNYGSSYDTKISQGKITTNLLAVNGGGLIDFRSDGNGMTIDSQNIKFYNSNAVNGGIEFSGGSPLATARDGAVGNELRVRYDRSFALTPITDESARICASSAAMQVGFIQSGSSTPDRQTTGLWVDNDRRHVNLGVWGADSTWARVEANTHNIHMQADKAHAWLSNDNVFHIYKDGDSSSAATKLQVDGWAWINGWVEAAGHSQHSALSTKTEIQPVDDDKMLKMVNDTDLATFLYKTDVANGETHRHIGLIIDDMHDVAQYQTPQDFIAPNGVSRDDDNMIGALFGAVKALTKRIKTLENKVG
nr:MAG TPA: minor structural protein [Caudoviricetes sp.]